MSASIDEAALIERLESAESRLGEACDEIIALSNRLASEQTLHAFWKAAAERALRLWERAEDKSETVLDAIDRVVSEPNTALTRAHWHELEALLDDIG